MNTEKTTNGISYTEAIANINGASFILFPEKCYTAEMIAEAKQEIKNNRDVVSIRVANEQDRDELYRTEIFIHPAVRKFRWYEINADDFTLLRLERLKGTTVTEYVESFVLPLIEETVTLNHNKHGDKIFDF